MAGFNPDAERPAPEIAPPPRWLSYIIAGLLAAAILLGGGGAEGPAHNGLIYVAALAVLLGLGLAHWQDFRPLGREAILPFSLLVLLLLIGVAQLIPLPPSIWHALPGRDVAQSTLALTSAADSWQTISLDPEATRRSLAALLLPATLMIGVLGAGRREALLFAYAVLACALLSAMIGALQLALGYPPLLTFYAGPSVGAAGVFANTNHHAALLLAAIVCVGFAAGLRRLGRPKADRPRLYDPIWLLLPIFAVMTLATGSNAGTFLLALAIPASVTIGLGWRLSRVLPVTLAILVVLGIVVSAGSQRGGLVGDAFVSLGGRSTIMADVLFTLRQYWPSGSGFGTFASAYAVNEDLDGAGRQYVNHAHNDFLEILAEAGIAGALWLALAVAALALRALKALSAKGTGKREAIACGAGLTMLGLFSFHSLVDYPVRTASIAAVAGVAAGLAFASLQTAARVQNPRRSPRWPLVLAALAALVLGGQLLRIFLAQAAVRAGEGATSVALRPQNGDGLALAAEAELAERRTGRARALAHDAIERSPFSVRAVRVLAIAEDFDGRGGMRAWRVASAMGWRDSPTQLWAMQQAMLNGEWDTAAIRADALMRTAGKRRAEAFAFVRTAAVRDPFRRELVSRLMLNPPWRRGFFALPVKSPEPQLQGVILVLRDLSTTGGRPTAEEAGRAINRLIQRKGYSQAIELYRAVIGREAFKVAMTDLRFRSAQAKPVTPFEWSIRTRGGSITAVEQSANQRVLLLATNGRERDRPVQKYTALSPGRYRLHFAMRGTATSPEGLGLAVYCVDRRPPLAVSSSDPLSNGFDRRTIDFAVPEDCPLLFIGFEAKGAGAAAQAEFSELSLDVLE